MFTVIKSKQATITKRLLNISIKNFKNSSTMPKFCANLSFMFNEKPFIERYALAKNAGFKAVESGFPFGIKLDELTKVKNQVGIEQVLINIFTGDVTKGELGFAAIPGAEDDFKKSLKVTIEYAKAIGAKKIHIMSGKVENPSDTNQVTYESNLQYAAGVLKQENLLGLIEPINNYSVPNYYLNSYERALAILKKVNSSNLKLMLDVFHLQLIKGNITNSIKDLVPFIGHVQIAQVPNRNEPNTPGEINYGYVFDVLKEVGYHDWIGLEYKPLTTTEEGLKWINDTGYSL